MSYIRFQAEYLETGSEGIGAGDATGIGRLEGTGQTDHSGAGNIVGVGRADGGGHAEYGGAGDAIGIGLLEGDGYALGAPINLRVWTMSPTHLHVEWALGGGSPDFCELERERWNGSAWVETVLFSYLYADPEQFAPATSYEDTAVVEGELYRYRAQAVAP